MQPQNEDPNAGAQGSAGQTLLDAIVFWSAIAALYVTLIWLYWPSLGFAPISLHDQEQLHALSNLTLTEALKHAGVGALRPAQNAFFWLLARGSDLTAYRAGLLGVFLLTVAFVQHYATEITKSWMIAYFAAGCWAVNPTTASVVCWFSAAPIAMCALGILAYVHCGQRVVTAAASRASGAGYCALAIAALIFALAWHEFAVLSPLLIVVYQRLWVGRAHGTARWLLGLSAACVASYVGLQLWAADGRPIAYAAYGASGWFNAAGSMRYLVQNSILWFWPFGMFGVSVPDAPAQHAIANALCWLLLLAECGLLWRFRHRDRIVVFGFSWFFGFMLLACVLPTLGESAIAQHHLYIPMLGSSFAASRLTFLALDGMMSRVPQRLRLAANVWLWLVFCWSFVPLLAETARSVEAWGDEEQLYLHTVENYPDAAEALGRLARSYAAREHPPARAPADAGFVQAALDLLLMRPVREQPGALIAHGRALEARGRYVEAGSAFARALAAGASGDQHFEAGRRLVQALAHAEQCPSAALLLERLREQYPTHGELSTTCE